MGGEWQECEWGDIATLEYGKVLRDYRTESGGYRVYGTNGPIGWCDEPLCDHPGVIIGRKGAYRGIHYSPEPFFVIDTAFYLEPRRKLDLRWAYYCLLTYDINGMDSGSAIPSTSREAFYRLPVRVPPLKEQRAIACILGSLDDKIELNRRMNRTLEEMARAAFKSWFTDFDPVRAKAAVRREHPKWTDEQVSRAACPNLKPEIARLFPDSFEDSELGEIPTVWATSTVDEEFELIMGQSPPGETYNETGDGPPFYQGRADFGFRFPKRRAFCTAPTRLARRGDTLVSVRAPVGDINMAIEDCAIGRGLASIRHKSGSRSFTYYSMRALESQFDIFEAEGTVFGSISKKDFHRLGIVAPPGSLVAWFEKLACPFDNAIERNEQESGTLAALRDTLLPKLISGELRIKDAERIAQRKV